MLLRQETGDGVDVLAVVGPVEQSDVLRLTQVVEAVLEGQPHGVVVDLREVTALSADAVGALRALADRGAQWPSATLCLCGAPERVSAALSEVVAHRTRDEALAHLRERGNRGRHVLPIEHSVHGPAQARRAVAECAARRGLQVDEGEDLLLVVSEMVTNAVRHGAPPVELEVVADNETVRVAVVDSGPGRPEFRVAAADAEGGRGMALVDQLCDEHGVRPQPPGKQVWAAVRRRPEACGS